jgi:hypothetical protein
MATAAQISANQRNAQHSTGPRTPSGKLASSRNAVRHGILASSIPASTPGFTDLLLGIYRSLSPLDEPQRMLVDQIAVTAELASFRKIDTRTPDAAGRSLLAIAAEIWRPPPHR